MYYIRNSVKHIHRRMWFAAICGVLVLGIPLSGGVQRRSSLMEAARQPILTFATALAANSVPAGILVPQSVFAAQRGTLPAPSDAADSLEAALVQFGAHYPEYRAVRHQGALVLRHHDVPEELDRLLQQPSANVQWSGRTALLAAIDVGRQISGEPDRGGGVAGTGPLPDGCPISAPINHRAQNATAIELLDAIVRQSKALVWILVFPETLTPELNLRLGLICGNERAYFFDVVRQRSEAHQ